MVAFSALGADGVLFLGGLAGPDRQAIQTGRRVTTSEELARPACPRKVPASGNRPQRGSQHAGTGVASMSTCCRRRS